MSHSTLKSACFTNFCSLNRHLLPFSSLNIGLFLRAAAHLKFIPQKELRKRKNYCLLLDKNCSMWVRPAWTCETGPSQRYIRCVRQGSPCLAFFFQPSAIVPERAETKSLVFDQQQGFNKTDCAELSGPIICTFTTLHICKYQPRPARFHSCSSTS